MKHFLLCIMLIFSACAFAQDWVFEYPGEGTICGIVETSDENVIIQSSDGTYSKILASTGDIVWSYNEPTSPQTDDRMVWQSLARIGSTVISARDEYWVLFDESTGVVSTMGELTTGVTSGKIVTTRVTRVKAIDGYFYITGDYLLPSSPGYGLAGGFITKISTSGTVIWSFMSEMNQTNGPLISITTGTPAFYTDIEAHPDGSGNLLVAASDHSPTNSFVSLIEVDAISGQSLGEDVIYQSSGDNGLVPTDMLITSGNPQITIVGYRGVAVPFSGPHGTFAMYYNTASNTVLLSSETVDNSGSGAQIYLTDVFATPSGLGSGGLIHYPTGESRLYLDIDNERFEIEDSHVYPIDDYFIPGSHCVVNIGQDYYIGTKNVNNDQPLLVKKQSGTPISQIICVNEITVDNSIYEFYFDNYEEPFSPDEAIYDDVLNPEENEGAVKELYCCDNFAITFSGNDPVCPDEISTISVIPNAGTNSYVWSSPNFLVFQSTANPNEVTVDYTQNTPGTYQLCVEITTDDGCVSTHCEDVEITEPIPHTLPNDMCESDNCLIFLSEPAGSGKYTVSGPGVSSSTSGALTNHDFCPGVAGIGSHDISITNNETSCSILVTVNVSPGFWPKTTSNTADSDVGVDVDADHNNNVYSLGAFTENTDFESFSLTTNASGVSGMALTKVDECGELIWIANSETQNVTPLKLDINSDLELIYVTGSYIKGAEFYPGKDASGSPVCSGGLTVYTTLIGGGAFLAVYNFDGCLVDVFLYPNQGGVEIEGQAVASHEFVSVSQDQRVCLVLK